MGAYLSIFRDMFDRLFSGQRDARVLMVGLDAAGKTTILYKLHLGEVVVTVPTIGFNVEVVKYKNVSFNVWDIGGQDKIRPLWKHYYNGSNAIIFVIDSNDRDRLDEARDELVYMLKQDELRDAAVLVLANKQDLPRAMTTSEISNHLCFDKARHWLVQGASATTGEGLFEGLEWLARTLQNKK